MADFPFEPSMTHEEAQRIFEKRLALLNKLAVEMDRTADSVHPSAWNELLVDDRAKYKKLAAGLWDGLEALDDTRPEPVQMSLF